MNVFRIHSLKSIRAFTMVELMGAVTISLVLIIMLYSIFDKVQKVFVTGQNRAIAMDEARSAMDILVDDFQLLNRVGDVVGIPRLHLQVGRVRELRVARLVARWRRRR